MAVFVWATGAISNPLGISVEATAISFSVNNRTLAAQTVGAIVYDHSSTPKTPIVSTGFSLALNTATIVSLASASLAGLTFYELEVRVANPHMDVYSNDVNLIVGGVGAYVPGSWFRDASGTENP